MSNILPSTKLKVVSVHKLGDTICWRKFFWRRVLNLESRNLNMNFWYGSVSGEGIEAMLSGGDWRAAMAEEDEKSLRGYVISPLDEENLKLNRRLIEASLEAAELQPAVDKMKLIETQIKFAVPLKCGVKFCGTLDGIGTYDDTPHMFEFKTAKQFKKNYKEWLLFDKQINGYAWAMRSKGTPLGRCRYCIFKKYGRRLGKKTLNQFVEQWKEDLRDPKREEYKWESISLGATTVTETYYDIEQEAEDLLAKFERAKKGQLLDPHYWPKRENKCHDYAGCEFLPLCSNPSRWNVFLRTYKQRTMLYEEEIEEVDR